VEVYPYGFNHHNPSPAFIAMVVVVSVGGLVLLLLTIVVCCRLCKNRKTAKLAGPVDYAGGGAQPTYNAWAPSKPPVAVDRKLAESAQMFHYQHQKQQMLEMEKAQQSTSRADDEESSEEDEGEIGPYDIVYECPGLATTGEMEVRNPLYSESPAPPPYNEATAPPPTASAPPHLVNGEQ